MACGRSWWRGQRPQVVALGLGRWEVTDHLLDGQWVHIGEPAWDDHLTADLQSAITIFQTFGAKVVLFTMPYVDPTDRQPDGLPWSENTPARVQAYNQLVRQVASDDPQEVSVIDLNRMLEPRRGVHRDTGRIGRPLRRHPHQPRRRATVAAHRSCPKSAGSAWRTRRPQGPTCERTPKRRRRRRRRPRSSSSPCRRPWRWHPTPSVPTSVRSSSSTPRRGPASNRCGPACCRRGRWPPRACWPTAPASSSPSPWPASWRPTATGC